MSTNRTLDALEFLAREVSTRRAELGLSRDEVSRRGGPSDTTLVRIEHPDSGTTAPLRGTLDKLDIALAWRSGGAAGALEFTPPMPVDDSALGASSLSGLDELDCVEVRMETINAIVRGVAEIPSGVDGEWVAELQSAARALMAAHTTEVLERVGGPGRSVPPLLEQTYLQHLAGPPDPPGPEASSFEYAEYRERLYRRWLVGGGRLSGLAPPWATDFALRWRAKQIAYTARNANE